MAAKVSIIIPTYNRATMLCRAIDSALRQTYTQIEIIVVDDCGTDDTKRVVGTFKDSRLIYFRQPVNTNMPASWDAGLRISKGDYFSFLGDDDFLRPEFVARRLECLEADAGVAGVFGCHERRGPTGELRSRMPANKPDRIDCSDESLVAAALVTNWFITASMYRRSLVMPAWNAAAGDGFVFDVGFNVRIVVQGLGRVRYLPTDDVVVTVHDGQVSCTKQDVMLRQKELLMSKLLSSDLPRSLARPIGDEFARWHVYWGRMLLQSKETKAAQRHFFTAARARPLWAHTWRQVAKGLLAGTAGIGSLVWAAKKA